MKVAQFLVLQLAHKAIKSLAAADLVMKTINYPELKPLSNYRNDIVH